MAQVPIQNQTPFSLFVHAIGRELRFGEIAKVEEDVAERLKATGILSVGEEVVEDIEKLKADLESRSAINSPREAEKPSEVAPEARGASPEDAPKPADKIAGVATNNEDPRVEGNPDLKALADPGKVEAPEPVELSVEQPEPVQRTDVDLQQVADQISAEPQKSE